MQSSHSKYSPLPHRRAFRVLRVFYSDRDQPRLCGELSTYSLDSDVPPYAALSYTWASPVDDPIIAKRYDAIEDNLQTIRIRCEDGPFWDHRIGRNLFAALKQIHPNHWRYYLWTDALCIDQDNVVERGSQVRLMQQLYARAERVICWVRPQDANMENIIWLYGPFTSFLLEWKARHGDGLTPKISRLKRPTGQRNDWTSDFTVGFDHTNFRISRGRLTSLVKYLEETRYFRRLWVLQEVSLARKLVMIYGQSELSLTSSNELLDWLLLNGSVVATILQSPVSITWTRNILSVPIYFRKERERWKRGEHDAAGMPETIQKVWGADSVVTNAFAWFEYLLSWGQRFEAGDAHDYVYGVCGLISYLDPSFDEIIDVEPRYNLPLVHIYKTVTKQLLSTLPLMLTFSLLGPLEQRRLSDLPSWVPDLSVGVKQTAIGGMRHGEYSCFGTLLDAYPMREEGSCQLSFDKSSLQLFGRRCGRISYHFAMSKDKTPTQASMVLNCGDICVRLLEFAAQLGLSYMGHQSSLSATLWVAVHCAFQSLASLDEESLLSGFVSFLEMEVLRGIESIVYPSGDQQSIERADAILSSLRRLLTRFRGHQGLPQASEIDPLMRRNNPPRAVWTSDLNFQTAIFSGLAGNDLFVIYPSDPKIAVVEAQLDDDASATARHRYVGVGPAGIQLGDELWILCKGAIPQILRPIQPTEAGQPAEYLILGEAYVQGGMWGELVHNGSAEPVEMIMLR